jgi:methionyl-tRNA formyltransferase
MKIVFMGTPDFAVPSLKKMIEKYNVSAIVTQPDKPSGRGNKVAISPIKQVGLLNQIPIFQPEKIRTDSVIIDKLKEIKPDFIIVVAYGQIITKDILDIPRLGCINLHASLLPKYRGVITNKLEFNKWGNNNWKYNYTNGYWYRYG